MPSLRRTVSNPIPRRLAPYTSSSTAARDTSRRRSSGSETTNRRVLADIEWWRVTDGQCSLGDQESEDVNRGTSDLALEVALGSFFTGLVEDSVEHLSMPSPWTPGLEEDVLQPSLAPPTEQFAVMSLTPHTPARPSLSLDLAGSSVESSPEFPSTPLDGHGLGLRFSVIDMDFFDEENRPARQAHNRYGDLSPIFIPSLKFDELSLKADIFSAQCDYADFTISPLSSAPDFLN